MENLPNVGQHKHLFMSAQPLILSLFMGVEGRNQPRAARMETMVSTHSAVILHPHPDHCGTQRSSDRAVAYKGMHAGKQAKSGGGLCLGSWRFP